MEQCSSLISRGFCCREACRLSNLNRGLHWSFEAKSAYTQISFVWALSEKRMLPPSLSRFLFSAQHSEGAKPNTVFSLFCVELGVKMERIWNRHEGVCGTAGFGLKYILQAHNVKAVFRYLTLQSNKNSYFKIKNICPSANVLLVWSYTHRGQLWSPYWLISD